MSNQVTYPDADSFDRLHSKIELSRLMEHLYCSGHISFCGRLAIRTTAIFRAKRAMHMVRLTN